MLDRFEIERLLAAERRIETRRTDAHGVAQIVHRGRREAFTPEKDHRGLQRSVAIKSPWPPDNRHHGPFCNEQHIIHLTLSINRLKEFCVDHYKRNKTMVLTGKRALITGASRGIGASIAKALAAEDADVAITYEKSADRAAEVVSAIKAKGRKAAAIQADSADGAAVQASVEKTVAALGGLDILVNNAGILRVGELKDITLA